MFQNIIQVDRQIQIQILYTYIQLICYMNFGFPGIQIPRENNGHFPKMTEKNKHIYQIYRTTPNTYNGSANIINLMTMPAYCILLTLSFLLKVKSDKVLLLKECGIFIYVSCHTTQFAGLTSTKLQDCRLKVLQCDGRGRMKGWGTPEYQRAKDKDVSINLVVKGPLRNSLLIILFSFQREKKTVFSCNLLC